MSELAVLLDANLSRGTEQLVIEEESVDLTRLGREEISELAELISGVARQGSPTAYRSARRQLERWRKGGVKLTLRSQERLRGAKRQVSARLAAFRRRGAIMRVYVVWGSAVSVKRKRRGEWLPPHEWIDIGVTVMRRVIREWAADEPDEAADLLFIEFLQQYGVPNPEDFMASAEVLELDLEPRTA